MLKGCKPSPSGPGACRRARPDPLSSDADDPGTGDEKPRRGHSRTAPALFCRPPETRLCRVILIILGGWASLGDPPPRYQYARQNTHLSPQRGQSPGSYAWCILSSRDAVTASPISHQCLAADRFTIAITCLSTIRRSRRPDRNVAGRQLRRNSVIARSSSRTQSSRRSRNSRFPSYRYPRSG
jgi:hypothetical protein